MEQFLSAKGWIRKTHEETIRAVESLIENTSLKNTPAEKMLEFGFGNGRSTYLLEPYCKKIIGVEQGAEKGWRGSAGYKFLKEKVGNKFDAHFLFLKEDIENASFHKQDEYDYICFFNVCYDKRFKSYNSIEEIVDDYICNIGSIKYMIKNGGYFYITFALLPDAKRDYIGGMAKDTCEFMEFIPTDQKNACLFKIKK